MSIEDLGFSSPEKKERELRLRFEIASEPADRHPERNEDAHFILKDAQIAGVLDGVSLSAGHVESAGFAAKLLAQRLEQARYASVEEAKTGLSNALRIVHAVSHGVAVEKKKSLSTTATLAAIVREGEKTFAVIAQVGDSRAIHLPASGGAKILTLDDTVGIRYDFGGKDDPDLWEAQEQLSKFTSKAELSPALQDRFGMTNVLTQALGSAHHDTIEPALYVVELQEGDRLLLDTDGINDNLTLDEIAANAGSAQELVTLAKTRSRDSSNDRAHDDDGTALLITPEL